jgi:hypothetical protein
LNCNAEAVVVHFDKEVIQTRGYRVAENATHRADHPDPSLGKKRLRRMTIKLHQYSEVRSISENEILTFLIFFQF